MIRTTSAVVLALVLLTACSTADVPPLTSEHPASSQASEAPLPPSSNILSLAEAAPVEPAVSQVPVAETHVGHDGHAGDGTADSHPKPIEESKTNPSESPHDGHHSAPQEVKQAVAEPFGSAFYTCPMHPENVSDKPGKCPKCSMKLIRTGRLDARHGGHE
jgi:hypothetical protein